MTPGAPISDHLLEPFLQALRTYILQDIVTELHIAGIFGSNISAKNLQGSIRADYARAYLASPATTPPNDALLHFSEITPWINEATNSLSFRVKYSNGSVNTATIAMGAPSAPATQQSVNSGP